LLTWLFMQFICSIKARKQLSTEEVLWNSMLNTNTYQT